MADKDTKQPQEINHHPVGAYDLYIAVVAIVSLILMVWQLFLPPDLELRKLLNMFDIIFCLLFFIDYIRHIVLSKKKWKYIFTWGLFDLASSIPIIGPFRLLRFAAILRAFRVLRSFRILTQIFIQDKLASTVSVLMLISTLTIVGCCIGVLHYELQDPHASIKSAEDVAWWAIVTTSTVGYGNLEPVTAGGRLLAVLIMCVGIGLFATFAGALAGVFIRSPKSSEMPHTPIQRFDALKEQNRMILQQLSELQSRLDRTQNADQDSGRESP
ncbi:MAG: ion transporter [Phycisphaerales bacterium]|nr:ion transporter [Phycisphaerales bacterium]